VISADLSARACRTWFEGGGEPDEGGQRLQAIGAPTLGIEDIRILEGDLSGDLIVGYHRDGNLIGVTSVGGPRATAATARYRATCTTALVAPPNPRSRRHLTDPTWSRIMWPFNDRPRR
jgi:hypothetical protein